MSDCMACSIEAEIGTEEVPHPVPARFHTCLALVPTNPAPPPEVVWGYAESDQAERWSGSCGTREEAVAEGRAHFGKKDGFWVRRGDPCKSSQFVPDGSWVIEDMGQRAGDEVGEAAEDWPDVPKEKEEELTKLLEDWADKNIPCRMWVSAGDPEYIPPEETAA